MNEVYIKQRKGDQMMKKTLVVHDDEGYILSATNSTTEQREPIGVPFLWAEVPEGKRIKIDENGIGVDVSVTPHLVFLEDEPKSETELLKEENTTLKVAIAELAEVQELGKLETQLALAELAEMMTGGAE